MDKNKLKIQTVVNKLDAISNNYRTMQLEVLAGNHSLVTTVGENGIRLQVDLGMVYWNSRLATERQRLISCFEYNDVVCFKFKQDLVYLSSTFCSQGYDLGFVKAEPFLDITSIYHFMQQKQSSKRVSKDVKSLAAICAELLGFTLSKVSKIWITPISYPFCQFFFVNHHEYCFNEGLQWKGDTYLGFVMCSIV